MDGVWELDSDTPITRILGGYGERAIISHGVEDGNDFTDRVVSRRNCYLLVIGVRNHISRIYVVEHDLIGFCLNRTVIEVMVAFRYLYWLIHSNVPLMGEL